MASNVYVLGAYSTAFQPWPDRSFADLVREAYVGALHDAGMDSGLDLSAAWFGNCLMSYWGQAMTRGSVSFIPLVHQGLFPIVRPSLTLKVPARREVLRWPVQLRKFAQAMRILP